MSKFKSESGKETKVAVGDRVRWFASDKQGVVKEIYLSEFPFYVLWDDGKDDWYRGTQLVKL